MCLEKKEIFLSVIVPIYNGEVYLDALTAMVKAQEFPSLELILVDDGSTDSTYEKCAAYAENYTWVQVIHTENHGVSHARNMGLSAARGEWIQFLDVDDKIVDGMFAAFAAAVKKAPVQLVLCSCMRKEKVSGKEVKCGPEKNGYLSAEEWKNLFCALEMEQRYWLLDYVWNKWYRRDLIAEYKLRFDETLSLGEDFVFNTHYCRYVKGAYLLQKAYYEYIVGEYGLVSRFCEMPWIGRAKLYHAQEELYCFLGLWHTEKAALRIQAGQIAFGDIRTINRKNCSYSFGEKLQFVKNTLESEQYSLMVEYLNTRKALPFRMYAQAFRIKNAYLITLLIYLEDIFG